VSRKGRCVMGKPNRYRDARNSPAALQLARIVRSAERLDERLELFEEEHSPRCRCAFCRVTRQTDDLWDSIRVYRVLLRFAGDILDNDRPNPPREWQGRMAEHSAAMAGAIDDPE
jgi:hypothetical protein